MELLDSVNGINYFGIQWSGQYNKIMEQVTLAASLDLLCLALAHIPIDSIVCGRACACAIAVL
jgi:hypothetical protein